MPKVFDRVKETSTSTGTGDFTLDGAESGFAAFSDVLAVGEETYYAIVSDSTDWEVGLATYSAANTLTRTTVYASTNSDNKVNFAAGTKNVFITFPAQRTVTDQQAVALAIALG